MLKMVRKEIYTHIKLVTYWVKSKKAVKKEGGKNERLNVKDTHHHHLDSSDNMDHDIKYFIARTGM